MNIKKFNRIRENDEFNEEQPIEQEQQVVESGLVTPVSLTDDIVSIFNERIGDEYTAHYFYRNAANWCRNANYKKATAFFDGEANSELDHAQGLQDYLTQWNLIPSIPSAPSNQSFTSLVDIINKAYNLEYGLFMKYSKDQQALLGFHPATFNFIQKYVDIQNDSVAEYSDLLNALLLVNIENKLDVLIFEDKYFG
jgi:ferritin